MSSILTWLRTTIRRLPYPLYDFLSLGGAWRGIIRGFQIPEVLYCDIFDSKYQVVRKLGFDVIQLCIHISAIVLYINTCPRGHRHVALKIHKREGVDQDEIEAYEQPSKGNQQLSPPLLLTIPEAALLSAFVTFYIEIQPSDLQKIFLKQSSSKLVNCAPMYASRRFGLTRKIGNAALSDFGSAPGVYRSPEAMLNIEWSYPIDIWNVADMSFDIGQWKADIKMYLQGRNKKEFLSFMRDMLQ
ncbi:conserved hypothetical protein [Microsporum canis CBS 113480]|uniref:Protein kinase domain-containing protein n=1 Tax=Arthroderma otae (strain ATCC MYA-4605 / CBS 113480) TaxID=554155 RepID=C5FBZ7_ARTOC|nr:conserved hypothetical protein [Microsporum canis CBS 113480]EEQ27331.1 conserved hypothetical protein [Microsporum canis CBS 113480]